MIVKIAKDKNIVDNPNARKLQKVPVPILGGIAVFFGEMVAIGVMTLFVDLSSLLPVIISMMVMIYIGVMDDIMGLSYKLRFGVEILVIALLVFVSGLIVNNFHGLWGIWNIPMWLGLPITVFACVGIINAINLIDGVNGLSSGFGIISCTLFGIWFFISGNVPMAILAVVSAGGLIPFFLHNVFGKRSRMFIGDGGALTLGLVLSVFVLSVLSSPNRIGDNVGIVAMVLAILAVPVFDTVRVMVARVLKGKSPFFPDKTHFHHLFISMGCSHFLTTTIELSLSLLITLSWFVVYLLGASIDLQLYIVVALSFVLTFGVYYFLDYHKKHNTAFYLALKAFLIHRQKAAKAYFQVKLRRTLDKFECHSEVGE